MNKKLFLKSSLKVMAIIFWLMAALAWNEVAKSLIDNFATNDSIIYFQIIYFFVLVVFVIAIVYYLSNLIQKAHD